eukprot:scaffold44255_cov75-Phaeocystis_antarctica.AAC.1
MWLLRSVVFRDWPIYSGIGPYTTSRITSPFSRALSAAVPPLHHKPAFSDFGCLGAPRCVPRARAAHPAAMAAIRREIKEVEAQLDLAEKDFTKINDRLRIVQQDRSNVEEELAAQNTRLKQMLDELALRKEQAEAEGQGLDGVGGSKMTMAELDRKVDAALLDVLEAKFRDEAFATAIIEQSAATGGDKVRVEFEGDEVFWTLQENYTFEMLLMDAARYWDVSPQDAVLADERGAVWPDDAYVALELQSAPAARIALRIKATATVDDDEAEYYGREDNGSDISEEEEQDFMAIAEAAEDELLLAQARGGVASLTNKQKIALKRKMKRELVALSASP